MKGDARAIRVDGRVQGVGYRWWAVGEAQRLGLRGWTRNRRDGSVEILAIGPAPAVEALVRACWDGPPAAAVTSVAAEPAEDDGSPDFTSRKTL